MPMLPWPVCPLAGHATLGQNVVVGSMLVSSEQRWGTYQEEVCLDPHFHCKRTIPRVAVEVPGGVHGREKASKRLASLHAMSFATERRYTAPPPDFTRYKLLEI